MHADSLHSAWKLNDRDLARSMRLNIMAGMLGTVWMSVPIGMPLPLLMRQVHATGVQLGILAAAWQFSMVAQLPSTLLVEHLRRRKPLWAIVSLIHRLLWAVPALLPWILAERRDLWPVVIIAALATSSFLGQSGTGPWQSWLADLIPPATAGRFWGVRHRCLSVSMVLSAFVYGILLDHFSKPPHEFLGFQLVFGLAAAFGTGDILLHLGVVEPPLHRRITEESAWKRIVTPLKDRDFLLLTLGMGTWTGAQAMVGYTMGFPGFFAMTYVRGTFGATYAQASWLFIASGVGAVLWTPRIGHWIDHVGGRAVALRLMAFGPLLMLAWLGISKPDWSPAESAIFGVPLAIVVMCIISIPLGAVYAGVWVSQIRLTQAHTSASGRTVAMGVHWCIVGLMASLGPLAAGWIKDHWSWQNFSTDGRSVSYFHVLILLQAAIAWGLARPLIRGIGEAKRNSADALLDVT